MNPPDRERHPAGPRAPLQTQPRKRSSRTISAPELSAELANRLRTAVIASSKWGWKKIDKGLDAAVVAAGTGVVVWIGAHYSGVLHNAFKAVVNWLIR